MNSGTSTQASLPFDEAPAASPATPHRLQRWSPDEWAADPDWQALIQPFWQSERGQSLARFVSQRLAAGAVVYPPQPLAALALTPREQVQVVIVGQDPYHGPGQAEGLAFSVAPGQKLPPSLRNIFKELERERSAGTLPPKMPPVDGSLVRWARQGVLLLNTCLTVEDGQPASHAGQGWEVLTESLIRGLAAGVCPLVFLLWGAHAQKFQSLIEQAGAGRHGICCANHPSPLSALRPPAPFLGCGHFSVANDLLKSHGLPPIDW